MPKQDIITGFNEEGLQILQIPKQHQHARVFWEVAKGLPWLFTRFYGELGGCQVVFQSKEVSFMSVAQMAQSLILRIRGFEILTLSMSNTNSDA